jgi:hypothetical protein
VCLLFFFHHQRIERGDPLRKRERISQGPNLVVLEDLFHDPTTKGEKNFLPSRV